MSNVEECKLERATPVSGTVHTTEGSASRTRAEEELAKPDPANASERFIELLKETDK